MHNAVGINVEGDLNLRRTTGRAFSATCLVEVGMGMPGRGRKVGDIDYTEGQAMYCKQRVKWVWA